MFNFFKKKDKHADLITAEREIPMPDISSYAGLLVKKYVSVEELLADQPPRPKLDPNFDIRKWLAENPRPRKGVPAVFRPGVDWRAISKEMQAGDVLWTYSSSKESWQNMSGMGGIIIVRGDKVVKRIMTCMN